jgi:general secretion pathway protein A
MTQTATLTATLAADKPTALLTTFDFHAVPFTREITTNDHLRWPFLDEALAGRLSAALARMPATLIAPAGTGKTALLRRLCRGLLEARDHVHDVEVTARSKRDMCRETAVACGAAPAGSYPTRVRRLRPRLRSRRRS